MNPSEHEHQHRSSRHARILLIQTIPKQVRQDFRQFGLWLALAGLGILLILQDKTANQAAGAIAMLIFGLAIWLVGVQRVEEDGDDGNA